MTEYLAEAKREYEQLRPQLAQEPQGCTPLEIDHVEQKLDVRLPAAYRQFLEWMGHGSGGALGEARCLTAELELYRIMARDLLVENSLGHELSEHALVFLADERRGYAWFDLPAASEDPPVKCCLLDQVADPIQIDLIAGPPRIVAYPSLSTCLADWERKTGEILAEFRELDASGGETVLLARYASPLHAHIVASALEAEGIRAQITGENMAAALGAWTMPITETYASVEVLKQDLDRAQEIVRQAGAKL